MQGCSERRVDPGIRRTRAAAAGASGWTDSPSLLRRRPAGLIGPGRGAAMPSRPDGASPGDCPPPPSARAGERHCPPARTVQAAGDSDRLRPTSTATRRPHRPGRERRSPPARTVQATGDSDCGADVVAPAALIATGPGPAVPPRPDGAPQCGRVGSHVRAAGGDPPPSPARAGERLCPPARTVQATGDSDCGPTLSNPPPSLARAWVRQGHPARAVPPHRGRPRAPRAGRRWWPATLTGPGRGATLSSRPGGASHR